MEQVYGGIDFGVLMHTVFLLADDLHLCPGGGARVQVLGPATHYESSLHTLER